MNSDKQHEMFEELWQVMEWLSMTEWVEDYPDPRNIQAYEMLRQTRKQQFLRLETIVCVWGKTIESGEYEDDET